MVSRIERPLGHVAELLEVELMAVGRDVVGQAACRDRTCRSRCWSPCRNAPAAASICCVGDAPRAACLRSCASSSVSPRIGLIRNSTLQSVGLAAVRDHVLVHVVAIGLHRRRCPWRATTMVSAWAAANLRPRGEPPAWAITGWPCGAGPEFSGPRVLKYLPWKLTRMDLGGIDQNAGLCGRRRSRPAPTSPTARAPPPCIRRPCRSAGRARACPACRNSSPR